MPFDDARAVLVSHCLVSAGSPCSSSTIVGPEQARLQPTYVYAVRVHRTHSQPNGRDGFAPPVPAQRRGDLPC